MILEITSMQDLDQRKLMDIYSEGNLENTDFFYPEIKDKKLAVEKVEADFLNYIESKFFATENNTYVILEKEDVWVSALRLYKIKDGFYYIEALETRPEFRKKGYASELLDGVINTFKNRGAFQLCDCVSKKNIASLKTHEKVGFEIISEAGIDYLCNEADERDYGMKFKYTEIRTQRLIISPLTNEEMKEWIRKENNSDLKQAYEQMLTGCVNHPEQRLWYAIWNMKVLGKDYLSVGDLCFKGLTNRGAVEIGYGIKKEYEGQGYMTEAVQAMAYWASQQEGVENVEAETESDNHASQRVLEKAGFYQNGVMGKEGPRYEYRKIKIDDSMIKE